MLLASSAPSPAPTDVETCMHHPLKFICQQSQRTVSLAIGARTKSCAQSISVTPGLTRQKYLCLRLPFSSALAYYGLSAIQRLRARPSHKFIPKFGELLMATKRKSAPHLSAFAPHRSAGQRKEALRQATGEKPAPPVNKNHRLRRRQTQDPLKAANRTGKERLTHAQYRQRHGADPARRQTRPRLRQRVRPHRRARHPGPGTPHHQTHRHRRRYAEGLRRHPRPQDHRRQ